MSEGIEIRIEPAIRFYRSLGAAPLEDWIVYRLTGEALARLASEGVQVATGVKRPHTGGAGSKGGTGS